MDQKGFANIILVVVVIFILVGMVGYLVFVKKSEPVAQQPTPTPEKTQPVDNQKPPQLLAPTVNRYTLVFDKNSICVIGSDEGSCTVLMSNFTGGENVNIDGLQGSLRKESDGSWSFMSLTKITGSSLTVKKLILNDNLVTNGHLIQNLSESGQKTWSLVYQPTIDDSAVQNPNRPASTIPLKFDEKSICGDTGEKNCSTYELHQNDWVFVRGIKYGGVLLVRLLTIPATAPSTLPQ